jgi:hypothetical protein
MRHPQHLPLQGTSKNSEFAQMQAAGKNFAAPHMGYMQARNFFRNAAVGMKSGFLEVPFALRPVSGLTSLDSPPSHDCSSQWHTGKSTLAYRCGGSSGIGNHCSRTCFPFNSSARRRAPQSGAHFTTGLSHPTKPTRMNPINRLHKQCLPFDLSALFKL